MLKFRHIGYYIYPSIENWYEDLAGNRWAIDRVYSDFIHSFKKLSLPKESIN